MVCRKSTVNSAITKQLCPHTLSWLSTLLVGGVGGAAGLLEWGHHQRQGLLGCHGGGDSHLYPDIHLLVRGLRVYPFRHWCYWYGKLCFGRFVGCREAAIDDPAILLASEWSDKKNVPTKLNIIILTLLRTREFHWFKKDKEPWIIDNIYWMVAMLILPKLEESTESSRWQLKTWPGTRLELSLNVAARSPILNLTLPLSDLHRDSSLKIKLLVFPFLWSKLLAFFEHFVKMFAYFFTFLTYFTKKIKIWNVLLLKSINVLICKLSLLDLV